MGFRGIRKSAAIGHTTVFRADGRNTRLTHEPAYILITDEPVKPGGALNGSALLPLMILERYFSASSFLFGRGD